MRAWIGGRALVNTHWPSPGVFFQIPGAGCLLAGEFNAPADSSSVGAAASAVSLILRTPVGSWLSTWIVGAHLLSLLTELGFVGAFGSRLQVGQFDLKLLFTCPMTIVRLFLRPPHRIPPFRRPLICLNGALSRFTRRVCGSLSSGLRLYRLLLSAAPVPLRLCASRGLLAMRHSLRSQPECEAGPLHSL